MSHPESPSSAPGARATAPLTVTLPEPGLDAATLWALATAKVNRAEQFGVEMKIENVGDEVTDTLHREVERQRVARALGRLTETQRQSIELAFYGGHTHAEVALLLDVPLGTVKTRIRDGMIRLRDGLGAAS